MMEPLKPENVVDAKAASLPDKVVEAFNELIAEHWDGYCSKFMQEEAVKRIVKKLPKLSRDEVLDKKYLDVEGIFIAVGWKVIYDKPASHEKYKPTFEFRKEK